MSEHRAHPPPSPPIRAIALLAGVLGACIPAPPAAPPACPTVAVPASAAAPAPAATAEASASAPEGAPAEAQMQKPKDAAEVGFCTGNELKAARDEVNAIAKAMNALPRNASSANAVTERIARLFESPCYMGGQLAQGLDADELKAARAWSVASWWDEGGYSFLIDALDHANTLHFAPSIPPFLATELLPADDPLRAVLCPLSGAECDPLAEAAALDVGREVERVGLLRGSGARDSDESSVQQACAELLRKKPPSERLLAYSSCAEDRVPKRSGLPGARYRSPKGWIVLRGRRGHHSFCDEARAYDLATGSAYIVSRCGGLVLANNGVVDQGATRDTGLVKTQVGEISADALRRLAFILVLKENLVSGARPYARYSLPTLVPMPEPGGGMGMGMSLGNFYSHSGQTRIAFDVFDGTNKVHSGYFVWPDSADIGDQVADDLVVSAEKSFREGCPRAALPAALAPVSSAGGVSKIDASPEALRKTAGEFAAAFAELHKTKVCKKK